MDNIVEPAPSHPDYIELLERNKLLQHENDELTAKYKELSRYNNEIKSEAINDLLDKIHSGHLEVTVTETPYRVGCVDAVEWIDEQAENLLNQGDCDE